jgi:hypothetical protein
MSDCDFDSISSNLSNILQTHISDRHANIQQIQQIQLDCTEKLRVVNLHYTTEKSTLMINQKHIYENNQKIANYNDVLAGLEKLRKSETTKNQTKFATLQQTLDNLKKDRSTLTADKVDITAKISTIKQEQTMFNGTTDAYILEIQKSHGESLRLEDETNQEQQNNISKTSRMHNKLSGLMHELEFIDTDIKKDGDLKEMLNTSTTVSGGKSTPGRFFSSAIPVSHENLQPNTIGSQASVLPEDDESSELNELSRKIQALNRHLALCKRTA